MDKRTARILAHHGYCRCGPQCKINSARGQAWEGRLPTGVARGHENCPAAAQFKEAIDNYSRLVAESKRALEDVHGIDISGNAPKYHLARSCVTFLEHVAEGNIEAAGNVLVDVFALQLPSQTKPRAELTDLQAEEAQIKRTARLLQSGNVAKALSTMSSQALPHAPEDAEVAQQLHPSDDGIILRDPDCVYRHPAPRITDKELVSRLKSRDPYTAAGPSGKSYATLQELMKLKRAKGSGAGPFSMALRIMAQTYIDGWYLHHRAHDVLARSLLVLLKKPDGRLRPIGIGEAFANLSRALVTSKVIKELRDLFPDDHGFAQACGTESLIHKLTAALRGEEHTAILALDCSNAFNELHRQAILDGTLEHAKDLTTTFLALYGKPSTAHVRLASGALSSIDVQSGVRQGDSAGPLFFMLGLLPVLQQLRESWSSVKVLSYLDDIFVVGDVETLTNVFDEAVIALDKVGLNVNPKKCWIFTKESTLTEQRAELDRRGLTVLTDGFRALGSVQGTAEFVQESLEEVLKRLRSKTSALEMGLERGLAPQALFSMLKMCVAPMLQHTLRTTAPSLSGRFAARAKALLRENLYKTLGLERAPDDNRAVVESLMFSSEAGLGLLDPEATHPLAYMAATFQTASKVHPGFEALDHAAQLERLCEDPAFVLALKEASARMKRYSNEEATLEELKTAIASELLGGPPKGSQKRLSKQLAEVIADDLRTRVTTDTERAALMSNRGAEARTTFSGKYSDHLARLDSTSFRTKAAMTIMYPSVTLSQDGRCLLCGKEADCAGWHATSCPALGMRMRTQRHTQLEKTVKRSLEQIVKNIGDGQVLGRSEYETFFAPRSVTATAPSTGDRIVFNDTTVRVGEKNYLLDYTVKSFSQDALNVAKLTTGAAAKIAEDAKLKAVHDKFYVPAAKKNWLVPFAAEVTGTLGGRARSFLGHLVNKMDMCEQMDEVGPAAVRDADADEARERVLWTHKARFTAAIARGVHAEVHRYKQRVAGCRAATASPA
jgi:hypothetical protein